MSSTINQNIFLEEILHPRIKESSLEIFNIEDYNASVTQAFKVVEEYLREKGKITNNLVGKALMSSIFRKENKPKIKLSLPFDLKEAQPKAVKYFESVFEFYRNYFAHNTSKIKNENAIRYLCIASDLMYLLDESFIPMSGIDQIDKLIDYDIFPDTKSFIEAIEYIDGQHIVGDDPSSLYEDGTISQEQYEFIGGLGIFFYHHLEYYEKEIDYYVDTDYFELTEEGQNILDVYYKNARKG